MKAFIFSLTFLTLSNIAIAQDAPSAITQWIDTNSVLISSQAPDVARRDCDSTMRILSIMSNNRIYFRSQCVPTRNPRCVYYYCYQLNVSALVDDYRRVEE